VAPTRRRQAAPTGSIEQLLAAKEIVIHCGSGPLAGEHTGPDTDWSSKPTLP